MLTWPSVLSQWSVDPSIVIGVVAAAVLYWRGWRPLSANRPSARRFWNAAAFYAGLTVVVLSLESPLDVLAAHLFTFHMIQHLGLIVVAAPLLILGDPGLTMLRGIPLSTRRSVLGAIAQSPKIRRLGVVGRPFRSPTFVAVLFVFDLYIWHWSVLFNSTLSNGTIHVGEHLCFLITALLFWSQIIDQRGLHAHLSYLQRALYTVLVGAAGNVLAMYLVFAPRPLYAGYASLPSRLYGMSTLVDQQIAGAIMWVPVLFIFGATFSALLYKALQEDERQTPVIATGAAPYTTFFPDVHTSIPN